MSKQNQISNNEERIAWLSGKRKRNNEDKIDRSHSIADCQFIAPTGEAKRRRSELTLAKKLQVLEAVDKPNAKRGEVAKQFGIAFSTLSTIVKYRHKILKEAGQSANLSRKRARHSAFVDLEESLFKWFLESRQNHVPVDSVALKEKANELAFRLGHTSFKCSNGWLDRFKQRKGLIVTKHSVVISGDAEMNVSPKKIVEDATDVPLADIVKLYRPCDVYNANEMGLFFDLLPGKMYTMKGETCEEGRFSERRLTVLLCCNMDGSDKMKLAVVGKHVDCFENVKSLPCDYYSDKNAYMTADIFIKCLTAWNGKLKRERRQAIIFVDKCTCHVSKKFSNLVVHYFSADMSQLQPIDQGIILSLKVLYRKRFVRKMLQHGSESGCSFTWTILDAITNLCISWMSILPIEIENCFRKAGFMQARSILEVILDTSAEDLDTSVDDFDEWGALQNKLNCSVEFEDYVHADDCVITSEDDGDESAKMSNDFILKAIQQLNNDSIGFGVQLLPTPQEVECSVSTLRNYLYAQNNVPEKTFEAFLHLSKFMQDRCSKSIRGITNGFEKECFNVLKF